MTNETLLPHLLLQRRVLSDGTPCPLPIRYFDDQNLVATFLTDMERAVPLLKGTGLQAVPQEDGKAIAVVSCWEYRDTDLGPYKEVALAILSVAPGDPVPAIYVLNLPVTTEAAFRPGVEYWGFNKFITAIDVKRDGKRFATTVRDPDDAVILTLEGRRSVSIPAAPTDLFAFTVLEGRVIKTRIEVPTPSHVSSGEGFYLKAGKSDHPMAKNLRALGLEDTQPVLVQFADPFQCILHSGRAL